MVLLSVVYGANVIESEDIVPVAIIAVVLVICVALIAFVPVTCAVIVFAFAPNVVDGFVKPVIGNVHAVFAGYCAVATVKVMV